MFAVETICKHRDSSKCFEMHFQHMLLFFFFIRERDKSNLGKIQESDILFYKCLFCSLLCTTTTTPVYFKQIDIEIHMPRCSSIVTLIEKIAI